MSCSDWWPRLFTMEQKKDIQEVLKAAFFRPDKIKEQKTLISIQGQTIGSEGGIVSIGGLPKARKSTFLFGLLASIFGNREVFDFNGVSGDVLLIDTEQTAGDFNRHLGTFYALSGLKKLPKGFAPFLFRQFELETIKEAIPAALEMMRPKYLVIDSITDMVYNVNDFEETKKFTKWIMKLSIDYNVCVVCLIHLSKSNNFTLGALGSALDRVSQSTLIVTKDKDTGESILAPLFLRSADTFMPVSISYNKENNTYETNHYTERKRPESKKWNMGEISKEEHKGKADWIFQEEKKIVYKNLIARVMNIYGIGDTYARRQVVPYLIQEKIIVNSDGFYSRF